MSQAPADEVILSSGASYILCRFLSDIKRRPIQCGSGAFTVGPAEDDDDERSQPAMAMRVSQKSSLSASSHSLMIHLPRPGLRSTHGREEGR